MGTRVYIDGTDITDYVAFGGFEWKLSDIDAPDSGRTLDALMHRGRVASKVRLDITCRPMTAAEAKIVLNLIYPEWVTVNYFDPMLGRQVTKTMYSNNRPASQLILYESGLEMWGGIKFPLIER